MTGIDIGGLHAGVGGNGAGVSIDGHGVGVGWNGNNDNVEGNGGAGVSVDGHGAGIGVNGINDNVDGNAGVGWKVGSDHGGYAGQNADGHGAGASVSGGQAGFGVNGVGDDVDGNAGVGWNAGSHHGSYVGESPNGQAHASAGEGNHDGAGTGSVNAPASADDASNQGQADAQQPPAATPASNGPHTGAEAGAGAAIGGGVAEQPPLALLPNPGVGASCTVLGGPARLLYLPHGAAGRENQPTPAINATSPNRASITPAPAGGDLAPKNQPITAGGNTFNPDYCYLSFSTLYATQSGTTIGPTFSNALIPFKTSEISTVCAAQPTATDGGRDAATPFNLAGLSGGDTGCYHVVAPPRIGEFIPSWDHALYWNVTFQQPQVILSEGAADKQPDDCLVCAAPAYSPPAGTAQPTIFTEGYPKDYLSATETAPPGSSAASFGQFTATRPDLASPTITGSPTSPFGSLGSNVSTSSVTPYTGAALTTASTGRLGLLVGMIPFLLAVL